METACKIGEWMKIGAWVFIRIMLSTGVFYLFYPPNFLFIKIFSDKPLDMICF